ncbi:MAG: hypothetical protein ACTSQF_13170 [Candidatus Heimdallarchaeaceae archaeon]
MTDQEKKGFKWPWDYFHFQTKGRGSIFANGVKGKFMATTYFAEWLVFWFALLMTAIVTVISFSINNVWALPNSVGWYFAYLSWGFLVSFIIAWFCFVFIIGPLTMSLAQYDFRAEFRASTPRELMFSKKSGKFWIWGILVDTLIVAPLSLLVPFFNDLVLFGPMTGYPMTSAIAWTDAFDHLNFLDAYWKAWVLAIIIIIFLLMFLKWQLGPNKKTLEKMKAQGPPK